MAYAINMTAPSARMVDSKDDCADDETFYAELPTPWPPESVTTDSAWAKYQASAIALLKKSDATIVRCYENAVAVPTEWVAYRKALRAIVSAASGDATAAPPKQPAYPSGT